MLKWERLHTLRHEICHVCIIIRHVSSLQSLSLFDRLINSFAWHFITSKRSSVQKTLRYISTQRIRDVILGTLAPIQSFSQV